MVPLVTKAVSAIPARRSRWDRMASSHPAAAAVSITRPSTHQPTLVYDQKSPAGPAVAASATSRDSA